MVKTNSLKEVPFGIRRDIVDHELVERRCLLEYVSSYTSHGVEWRPNEPFLATLTLERLERGRSAARFWFSDQAGTWYPMFGPGLCDMLKQVTLNHGGVTAIWIAVKRGANYGIELYEEQK